MEINRALITGTAGIIGFHLAELLFQEGCEVTGFDGMTDYFNAFLKKRRHDLRHHPDFTANEALLEDADTLSFAVTEARLDVIVHLATQAGVEDFFDAIESATGCTATPNCMDMQPTDVPATSADASLLRALTGYVRQTELTDGVGRFVEYCREYHGAR